MHRRFAERLAAQIRRKKFGLGWKPPLVEKWLKERFPLLTPEDAAQVAEVLDRKK